ncbi:ParB/RepB/Spo0J family partition protein [Blautia obeum]|uniref:Chromosome-partitioning protein Spo0J n=1 Tax=Blautia obeum TaxID=40520 RepID=A0A564SXK0_9FIRM|nr:ParB/RepB/Spo0J family partition protein [Blautia obeum]VUW99528.1 Chromosome-partitioning protein Spo0J [Blautia obeum]
MNEMKNIQMADLISAPDNPFKVTLDTEMERLIESIAETGIIAPIIVRPTENGKYEIVSGHRRKYACEYLGMATVPAIIKDLDRNEAVIFLVDSNLQRENILPSERAFAYKMKLEALKHQGKASVQVEQKLSRTIVAESCGVSDAQIQRYIRLTNLIPPILDMVDEKSIAFTPAVELSYLLPEEQTMLLSEMEYNDCTPNLSQAQRIKTLSMQGLFTEERLSAIMSEEKANQKERVKIPADRIRKYFPKDYTTAQIEETIVKLCEAYHRKRLRDRDSR